MESKLHWSISISPQLTITITYLHYYFMDVLKSHNSSVLTDIHISVLLLIVLDLLLQPVYC